MKKILGLFVFLSLFVIITFLLFADFERYVTVSLEHEHTLFSYIGISTLFLILDILMPIPSSLIMILNGKILGFSMGAGLSFIAGMISSTVGFVLGGISSRWLNRLFSEREVASANQFFKRYGTMSVAVTRAIPILSEVLAVMAGTMNMKWHVFLLNAAIGHILVSTVYAYVGAFAAQLDGHVITVVVVLAALSLSWISGKFLLSKAQ